MRIGLDIHQIGERQTGNETYLVNLISALVTQPSPAELVLYRTRRSAPTRWDVQHRRIWPHQAVVRIPFSFPLAFRRDAIDIAHFQYVTPPVCPCPVSVIVHDISFETHPEYFPLAQRTRMRTLIPLSAQRAQGVMTISEFTRQELITRYGLSADRVIVTPLAAAPAYRPLPTAEQDAELAALDVPAQFLLAVGNLQPRKNLARLIAAYARLRAGGVDAPPLLLVGQSHYRGSDVVQLIERLDLTTHVRLTGYVTTSQLVALYNRASAFVYPSLYEGFGLPILEAMACGTPVITSTVTAMPEVAGDAALLVDPHDELALAEAMARVLGDPTLRSTLRTRGHARADAFSWDVTAARTRALWQRMAEAR